MSRWTASVARPQGCGARAYRRARAWLVAAALFAAGCGGPSAPEHVPVRGRLTLEGRSLVGVVVGFWPQDADRPPGKAVPSAGGLFNLRCPAGRYKVTVAPLTPDIASGLDGGPFPIPAGNPGAAVPGYYHDARTTPFVIDVPAHGTDAVILDLVRGKGKR